MGNLRWKLCGLVWRSGGSFLLPHSLCLLQFCKLKYFDSA
uniref:Uncharacterized protein n=1 Tax=Arundo donax TaxID=35708 RepID=A0A0A8ZTB7_ARUDO